MGQILPVLESVRRIVARWAVTETPLTADAASGTDVLTVRTTQRFNPGDIVMVKDGGTIGGGDVNDNVEANLMVLSVIDYTHIQLSAPLNFTWTVAANCYLVKTPHGRYIKSIFLGEPSAFPENSLPAITVSGENAPSEWYTIRATKERYNIKIGIFIEDSTDEAAAAFHYDLAGLIDQGLKKNVYPLVADYKTTTVTHDITPGDNLIRVQDTSIMEAGRVILIEDQFNAQENKCTCVYDATTFQVDTTSLVTYKANDTHIIVPNRFIFNSWPADTKFGSIYKGTLLKSAVISYFAEEIELQLAGPPWQDTQLK